MAVVHGGHWEPRHWHFHWHDKHWYRFPAKADVDILEADLAIHPESEETAVMAEAQEFVAAIHPVEENGAAIYLADEYALPVVLEDETELAVYPTREFVTEG